jgi:hypothetical protein
LTISSHMSVDTTSPITSTAAAVSPRTPIAPPTRLMASWPHYGQLAMQ